MDVFEDINEIIVLNEHDDIDIINYDNHQCVIFQHIPYNDTLFFDDILELDKNEKDELRAMMSVNFILDIKYISNLFSRHGRSFKHWWLQKE